MSANLTDDFSFSEYAKLLEKCFDRFDGRVKHSAKSAFRNIRLSWRLRSIDQGMSALRAITAEEEAATALFSALKRQAYPNSDKLDFRRHDHKAAVFVLIQVVSRIFARLQYTPQVHLVDVDTDPKIRIQIDINELAGVESTEPRYAEPLDPLDFSVENEGGRQILAEEFSAFCSEKGFANAIGYLKREANTRNQILYSSNTGFPSIKITDEFIQHRKDRVVAILTIALMIQQTVVHQRFVVQCLDALLTVLVRLDIEGHDYSSRVTEDQSIPIVQIARTPDSSVIEVVRDGRAETAHFEYRFPTEFVVRWLDVWDV